MLTWKRSILGIALLASGFLACSDNNNNNGNKDAAPLVNPDAPLGTGGMGAGGIMGTGGSVGIDGPTGAGGGVAIDAAPGAGGSVGIDAAPGAGGSVGIDALSIDSGGGSVPNLTEHLQIINAPTTAASLTVTGTSATYDKATGTCK